MPTCQHCGSHTTAAFARVFTPNDVDEPRCCPNCEGVIRDGAEIRPALSHRGGGDAPTPRADRVVGGGE